MVDILIRDVPEQVVIELDAQAARLQLSRSEYVRRQLAGAAGRLAITVTADDLRASATELADLLDEDVMDHAWR